MEPSRSSVFCRRRCRGTPPLSSPEDQTLRRPAGRLCLGSRGSPEGCLRAAVLRLGVEGKPDTFTERGQSPPAGVEAALRVAMDAVHRVLCRMVSSLLPPCGHEQQLLSFWRRAAGSCGPESPRLGVWKGPQQPWELLSAPEGRKTSHIPQDRIILFHTQGFKDQLIR